MLRAILASALALAALNGLPAPARNATTRYSWGHDACDPNAGILNDVQRKVDNREWGDAAAAIRPLLHTPPRDFRTTYLSGMLLVQEHPPQTDAGIAQLEAAANMFGDKHVTQCADRMSNWYAIYNTLGALYLQRNDLVRAERYLRAAEAKLKSLDPQTQYKVQSNLALLSYRQKNLPAAEKYYTQAKATAGTKGIPAATLQEASRNLAAVKSLSGSAH